MIDSVGCTRQAIEVFTQNLARQENRADAKASPANFGRDVVLVSFVLLGLGDVSDWRLVDITDRSGSSILADEDFRAYCLWRWNRKCDLVADGDVGCERARQQKFCLIRKHARGGIRLALDVRHTLAAHRNGRAGRCKSHAVGGQYRTALRKCKTRSSDLNSIFQMDWLVLKQRSS